MRPEYRALSQARKIEWNRCAKLILCMAATDTPSDAPVVSVLMIAYNHEKYIAQAISSVLEQKTDFPVELIVADDASTDRTPEIVESLRAQHPETIRLIRRMQNLGPQRNFVEALHLCRGRFIALLEGDDYWISSDKLARQVDVLQSRPECSICFTRARVVYEDESHEPWDYPLWPSAPYTFDDLAKENFVPTCTALFRHGLLLETPPWFSTLAFGDWAIHLLLARQGDLFLIAETMAVYRVHARGVWSGMDQSEAERKRADLRARIPDLFSVSGLRE